MYLNPQVSCKTKKTDCVTTVMASVYVHRCWCVFLQTPPPFLLPLWRRVSPWSSTRGASHHPPHSWTRWRLSHNAALYHHINVSRVATPMGCKHYIWRMFEVRRMQYTLRSHVTVSFVSQEEKSLGGETDEPVVDEEGTCTCTYMYLHIALLFIEICLCVNQGRI